MLHSWSGVDSWFYIQVKGQGLKPPLMSVCAYVWYTYTMHVVKGRLRRYSTSSVWFYWASFTLMLLYSHALPLCTPEGAVTQLNPTYVTAKSDVCWGGWGDMKHYSALSTQTCRRSETYSVHSVNKHGCSGGTHFGRTHFGMLYMTGHSNIGEIFL